MNAPAAGSRHVVLVGMMGVGKSTVGRALARAMDRTFCDSDDEIVARTGRSVAEIFAADGEPAFRALEIEVMADLLDRDEPSVIAAAGGAVLAEATRQRLRRAGTVVWLSAPVQTLVDRTASGAHRPALADDPAGTLTRLSAERDALYAEVADLRIDATDSVDVVVDAVLAALVEGADR